MQIISWSGLLRSCEVAPLRTERRSKSIESTGASGGISVWLGEAEAPLREGGKKLLAFLLLGFYQAKCDVLSGSLDLKNIRVHFSAMTISLCFE